MTATKKLLCVLVGAVVLLGCYFLYMSKAFPTVRCEGRHLAAGDLEGDCYGCHLKATARVAQEWFESKHGVVLVRCQTCHGMPDGKGALPFTRTPGVDVCARCHSLAIQQMELKFGARGNCMTCHPHHQSPMHGKVYEYRIPSSQKEL